MRLPLYCLMLGGLSIGMTQFMLMVLPVIPAIHGGRLVDSLKVFNHPRMWLIIGISAIGADGIFAWISYVSKLIIEVAGLPLGWMFLVMILAGLGMALGNYLGGRLSDHYYLPQVVAPCLLGLMVVTLLLVALLMTFVTGVMAFAVVSPLQMLVINSASGAMMLASCLIQSTSNMGNVLGSYLGVRAIAYGYTSPQYVGMVLAGISFIFSLWLLSHRHCDDADRVEEAG